MDKVFTVDDNVDKFRSPPEIRPSREAELGLDSSHSASFKMMNRSPSEWAFQLFLQEASASVDHNSSPSPRISAAADPSSATTTTTTDSSWQQPPQEDVVEITDHNLQTNRNIIFGHKSSGTESATDDAKTTSLGAGPAANVPIDSKEYQAFLKSRLYLACAAVAFSRGNCVEPQDSAGVLPDKGLEASISNPGSLVPPKGSGNDFPERQEKNAGGPIGTPTLTAVQKKSSAWIRSTSDSEQSDDDEAEGEAETTHQMGATDAKRARRALSNRESARRSRRRKQVHLTELETQVSQLKIENSSLLKRLTDISQKHNDAAVDNRILKADVETLRAKVKMAEETVKRVTGMNPALQAMSDISIMSMPFFADSPSDTSADSIVPVPDDADHHYYQALCHIPAHDSRIQNGLLDIPPVDHVQQGPVTAAAEVNNMGGMA